MTDHVATIAEALCREVHPWLWEELSAAPCDECTLGSQALVAAGIGVLDEARREVKHWKDHAEEAGEGFSRVCKDYARVAARNTELARQLESARIGVLPEADATEEWGVRRDATIYVQDSREHAVYFASRVHGDQVVRRTRTRYAEHVTEWEAVDE